MKNKFIITMSIVLILIVLISGYARNSYEGFESSGKNVVICKADWCGHCKKAAPEFNKLVAASPITLADGSKATVKILDGDKDKAEVAKYNVKGFPSILIVDGQTITEYPGERTMNGVISFLNSM